MPEANPVTLGGAAEDLAGEVFGDGFEVGEGAAGCDAGVFEEGGVEEEGAAIDEGVIGGFEGLAAAALGDPRQDAFVHLEIGLEFECGAGVPVLHTSECVEKFAAESSRVGAREGLGFELAIFRLDGAASDEIEGVGGHGEEGFAVE